MHFTGQGDHLGYFGCDFIERYEDTLGATPKSSQVMGSSYQDVLFAKMINMDI
jgi:hypothetical protein